jgi:hypothetical protein
LPCPKISNLLALIITLVVNGISNNADLFGNTIGELGESRAIFFFFIKQDVRVAN